MKKHYTITGESRAEFIEKRSKFICYASHAENEDDALNFVNAIKSKHWNAKHNVYAYSIKDNKKRCSDDGEPHGTAGRPIMGIIENKNIIDTVIVITRYFGGTLLGKGGLVRAYTYGAELAIENSRICEVVLCFTVFLKIEYSMYGKVFAFLSSQNIDYGSPEFKDSVNIRCFIPEERFDNIFKYIKESYDGKVGIELEGKHYRIMY